MKGGGKKGKKDSDDKKTDDNKKGEKPKDPYKEMECFNCGKKGHPARFCPEKKDDEDDSSSISSKSSSKKLLEKQFKSIEKSFTQLQAAIEESDSDSSDEHSHFQFLGINDGLDTVLSQKKTLKDADLQNVILLDNQSTVSLFCNPRLVGAIEKTNKPLCLQSNAGQMVVRNVAEIGDTVAKVWFSKRAITNILSLKMVRDIYPVSYDCERAQFVVQQTDFGKPNMIFWMHPSGLHIHDPTETVFSFVTTVEGNKAHFTKRQIKGAEKAQTLYAALGFPSEQDFRWMLQSHQIKDCPVTMDDADVAFKIWGKNIAALKGKTI